MSIRNVFVNSITINMPKNILQFFIGVVFYFVFFGNMNPLLVIFSCVAFLVSYSAVYVYNDIIDAEDDARHPVKRKWKLVASGLINKRQGMFLYVGLASFGLFMSFFVNVYFFIISAMLIFLNLLHSSPKIYLKKDAKKALVNMTAIEFLKYSMGWFALTSNISLFPFWVIFFLALSYNIGYFIYKSDFKKIMETRRWIFTTLIPFGTMIYLLAFVTYTIPVSLILMIVMPSAVIIVAQYLNIQYHQLNKLLLTQITILIAFIVSFMAVTNPVIAKTNEKVAFEIKTYANAVKEKMPPQITRKIESLDLTKKYQTLDEIAADVNKSIKNMSRLPIISPFVNT